MVVVFADAASLIRIMPMCLPMFADSKKEQDNSQTKMLLLIIKKTKAFRGTFVRFRKSLAISNITRLIFLAAVQW